MPTYTIVKKPQDLDWKQVPALAIDSLHWTPAVDITAQAQVCYDDKALYVRLSAQEEHIRAEVTSPFEETSEDSCLEFFFSPIPGDIRYINIEFNFNGCMYLGMGTSMDDLVRLIPEDKELFHQVPRAIPGGWEITYQIPVEFVQRFFPNFQPVSGGTMRGNFYKCGDLTPQPHYLSWSPLTNPTPAFHCPQDFGGLIFA